MDDILNDLKIKNLLNKKYPFNCKPEHQKLLDTMLAGKIVKSITCHFEGGDIKNPNTHIWEKYVNTLKIENFVAKIYRVGPNFDWVITNQFDIEGKRNGFSMKQVTGFELYELGVNC